MIAPREPSGHSNLASWCRKILRYAISNEVKPGYGYRVRRTTTGTVLEIKPGIGGGLSLAEYKVKEHKAEYLVCRTWDGALEGEDDIKIAKPRELRYSILRETIDGYLISYSAYNEESQTRHAYYSLSYQEDQIIVPRYITEGDYPTIIWAGPMNSGVKDENGIDINLLDVNISARAWAKMDETI